MDSKELFENNCMPLFWLEDETTLENSVSLQPRKDLGTLLAELDDIQNRIDDLTAKEWRLEKLVKFHKEGFTTH